jgi:TctA family transporter
VNRKRVRGLMRQMGLEAIYPRPRLSHGAGAAMLENAFRLSLIMARGKMSFFLTRPISAGFIVCTAISLAIPMIKGIAARRIRIPQT